MMSPPQTNPTGRVCGLALLHGAPLPGFHLTRPLRRLMLHQDLDSDDLHVVDAQMASALQVRTQTTRNARWPVCCY